MKRLLVAAVLTLALFGCSKSNSSGNETRLALLSLSLDGVVYSFEGSSYCKITILNASPTGPVTGFRFSGSKGSNGDFINIWTSADQRTTVVPGDYVDEIGDDMKLTGITSTKGTVTVTITTIDANRYHSGTITGNLTITKDGVEKLVPIVDGSFTNLEVK